MRAHRARGWAAQHGPRSHLELLARLLHKRLDLLVIHRATVQDQSDAQAGAGALAGHGGPAAARSTDGAHVGRPVLQLGRLPALKVDQIRDYGSIAL
jgi:hypothetical protein